MEQLPGPARGLGPRQAPHKRLRWLWGWMWWDPAQGCGGSSEPTAARLCSRSSEAAAPPQAPPPQPTRDPPSAACAQAPHMVRRAGGQEMPLARHRGTLGGTGIVRMAQRQQETNQSQEHRPCSGTRGCLALPGGEAGWLQHPGPAGHSRADVAEPVPRAGSVSHHCLPLPLSHPPLTGCCPAKLGPQPLHLPLCFL